VVTLVQRPDEDSTVYHGQAAIRTFVRTYPPRGYIGARSHYRAEADRIVWMARVSADCFQHGFLVSLAPLPPLRPAQGKLSR
jgi:hypothetical protein